MQNYSFIPDETSGIPKFQQLIDSVILSINQSELKTGDSLPSVNHMCKQSSLSRDTVVKAYNELKRRGIIESVPNKGYYVATEITKVFLFLDTFKAYKEVLYNSFREHLPGNVFVDVHFHHYNYRAFENIILDSIGKYSKYIIMNFDDKRIVDVLQKLPVENLLVIDWNIHTNEQNSYTCQDFGNAFYENLCEARHLFHNYDELIYIYPDYTWHPKISIEYFMQFCAEQAVNGRVVYDFKQSIVKSGKAFISLEDKELIEIIEQCRSMKFRLGQDVGLLSYNETPMKRIINEGISVISTNFVQMGKAAAEYVVSGEMIKRTIPTSLIIRESL